MGSARKVGQLTLGALALACAACAPEPVELPPRGEALVVVDTDAPIPRLVGRLRIDVYDDGSWLDSRDVSLADPLEWPTSFSVYTNDEKKGRRVRVRLRAYPDGRLRDYRGERFTPRPSAGAPADPVTVPPGDGQPRLQGADGADVTPAEEPQPSLAVDRLVQIDLHPGTRGSVRLVLRSACVGTMADLAGGASCVETEGVLEPVAGAKLSADMSRPGPSTRAGTFGSEQPCTLEPRAAGTAPDGSPLHDEEACVPGGLVVLGSPEVAGLGELDDDIERVAVIPPLRVDRYEVTVGRWRAALAAGFVPPSPPVAANADVDLSTLSVADGLDLCTWSAAPLPQHPRDSYPLSCVTWSSARAFCQLAGGDLPTEAQWERVAAASGRANETRYPWGQDDPGCEDAVYARSDEKGDGIVCTATQGLGPRAVTASEPGDVTPGLGVVGLGGSLSEWTLDTPLPFASVCWATAPLDDPRCSDETAPTRSVRGSSWTGTSLYMLAAIRQKGPPIDATLTNIGFRCVRPGS